MSALPFTVALWIIARHLHALGHEGLEQAARYLFALPADHLLAACALTAAAYLMLAGFDLLALRHIGSPLPVRVAVPIGLIAFGISNTLGQVWLTGGAVRARLYSAAGLSARDIGRVVVFVSLTFWLGYLALGAVSLTVGPSLAGVTAGGSTPLRAVGTAGLIGVGAYVVWCAIGWPRTGWLAHPSFPVALAQLTISIGRAALMAAVLYVLLPEPAGVTYATTLTALVLAATAGSLSQVPGGAGVLDAMLLLLLAGPVAPTALLGTVLALRLVYYLVPLTLAAGALVRREVHAAAPRSWAASRADAAAPPPQDVARAAEILTAHPSVKAYLALLGDTRLLFSPARTAFIMYAARRRRWIALGDPVGPAAELPGLARRFWDACAAAGVQPAFYEVPTASLPHYTALGLHALAVAEEARVPLASFTMEGRRFGKLRNAVRRAEKAGCTFERVTVSEIGALLPELRAVSDAWLSQKRAREKRFSLGYFDEDYVRRFSAGVVRQWGEIIAFATVWAGPAGDEVFLDLMRARPGVPRGTTDLLFTGLLRWARAAGYSWFNLGMAPLARLTTATAEDPRWRRLAAAVVRRFERFYNVQGLREYKDKFGPEWRPRCVVAPTRLGLAGALIDVVALTSGGLRGLVSR